MTASRVARLQGQDPAAAPQASRLATGPPRVAGSLLRLSLALAIGYASLAGGLVYWQVVESSRLTNDPLNPLVLSAARQAPRGSIFDRTGKVLAHNVGGRDEPLREYPYFVAAPVVGYRSGIFGTAGLEHTYDAQLTGLVSLRPGDELLRKFRDQPYNPSDLMTSLDVELQQVAGGPARRPARRGCRDRAGDWPGTGPRQQSDLQPQSDRRSAERPALRCRPARARGLTAAQPIDAGTLRSRIGFQDRHRDRRSGLGRHLGRRRSSRTSRQSTRRASLSKASGSATRHGVSSSIIRSTSTRRPKCRATSGTPTRAWKPDPSRSLDYASRLGFGQRIPFELPTSPSQVTGGDGPLNGFRDFVEVANAAYGQGEVLVTPLQMALVASTVANDGLLMRPKLVDELRASDGSVNTLGPSGWSQVISPFDAQIISDAMQAGGGGAIRRRLGRGGEGARHPDRG